MNLKAGILILLRFLTTAMGAMNFRHRHHIDTNVHKPLPTWKHDWPILDKPAANPVYDGRYDERKLKMARYG